MSAKKVETFAEIVKEMRVEWAQVYFSEGSRRKDGEYCDNEFVAIEPSNVADRLEAAHNRDVARLVAALKALAEDTCQHCDARYCRATCHNGEPQIPCRVVYEAQQIVREFAPEEPKQDADDDMPFG